MFDFVTSDYSGAPFELFGVAHIMTMIVTGVFGWAKNVLARRGDDVFRRRLRIKLALYGRYLLV